MNYRPRLAVKKEGLAVEAVMDLNFIIVSGIEADSVTADLAVVGEAGPQGDGLAMDQ